MYTVNTKAFIILPYMHIMQLVQSLTKYGKLCSVPSVQELFSG